MRCQTPYCLEDARIHSKTKSQGSYCEKCVKRRWRREHPDKSSYGNLRANAKRREIDFYLTLKQWIQFCADTGYLELRGTGGEDMTVDRKDPRLGYTYSNIQMLSNNENKKKHREDMKKGWSWKQRFLNGFIDNGIQSPF